MDLYPIRNRDTAQALKANKPGLAGPSYKLLTIALQLDLFHPLGI